MHLRLVPLATVLVVLIAPASACADFAETVLPGESLDSIAATDGVSVDQLAANNGLSPDAQLTVGETVMIPPQDGSASGSGSSTGSSDDGDADSDDPTSASTASSSDDGDADSDDGSSGAGSGGGGGGSGTYVVQPGDTLDSIAASNGMSVSDLAAANGLDPNGILPVGVSLTLGGSGNGGSGSDGSAPAQAPAVGTSVTGSMTWFGGPDDPTAGGAPASGLGYTSDGMAFYNSATLGGKWLMQFPWGQELMTQIDLGPAPWTGNAFDLAYTALPNTPYNEQTWPNPTVTGTYEGK